MHIPSINRKILFATVPAAGHVNPALPIAAELVRRGHEVVWYTGSAFRTSVEATGARFAPIVSAHDPEEASLVDRFPERVGLTGLAGIRFDLKHGFIDEIPYQVEDLQRILVDFPADLVVADFGVMGVAALHELGGPPWVTIGITPLPLPSRDTAPFGLGLPPVRSVWGRLRSVAVAWFQRAVFRDVERHHRIVRAGLGLPASTTDVFRANMSPFLFVQSGTPAMEYPRSDLPAHIHFVGPLLSATSTTTPSTDWAALAAGRPIVLVTQGTIATDADALVGPALRGLADQDVFVVAVSAAGSSGLPVPANAVVEHYVPYDEIMPLASAMVTNGGFGGVQHALAHGVPLVVAGATEDKPEVAARVAWTGAGINLRTGQPTEHQVRDAVRRVLDDTSFRMAAGRIRDDYALHDAGVEAADLVLRLTSRGEPVFRAVHSTAPVAA